MARLIRDRYFAYDADRGCDLVTGDEVRLDDLPDISACTSALPGTLAPLVEVFGHGRDGDPRWVVANATNASQAGSLARAAATQARQRGFVPILAELYLRHRDALADDLSERTLLLIGTSGASLGVARAAFVDAAARSPRPHVLLTFRLLPAPAVLVRESRSAYRIDPCSPREIPPSPDVVRYLQRADRAAQFARSGRHAAADRLSREVAAALARRKAHVPAAQVLIDLGRLLLESGRVGAADAVFEDAADQGQSARAERVIADARIWQAVARTDGGRLKDAEAICRAVLLTTALSPARAAWTRSVLARVLLWQDRVDEAARLDLACPLDAASGLDDTVMATMQGIAVRVSLARGHIFEAGQEARALLQRVAAQPLEPRAGVIAHTGHLRVLAVTGDLALAEQALREVARGARKARAPLAAVRARVIWWDMLRRAGRTREAAREAKHLQRICRATPPLLRGAIERRVACALEPVVTRSGMCEWTVPGATVAAGLVRIAQEEEDDGRALQRILAAAAAELQTSRVDLVSADAGPATALMSAGSGLPTHLGTRVVDAGISIPVEMQNGGREAGVPVRLGARLLAAVACRWPLDREPPPHAVEYLELAAAIAAPRVEALLTDARDTARASTSIPELVGSSAAMGEVRRAIARAATAPFSVLIEGESGAGKELVARAVHQLGPRRERRFCDVNCAALPDDLLESELFGHARGAFTGAVTERAGLFEDADGGTVFLDELPDLSPRGQAKLLRVLQQQEVRRIGETFSRAIDVRLVTATNRDMKTEVAGGRFRQDLLYRLDVIRICIPPLRDRPEDIPVLATHFWSSSAPRVGSTATLTHGVLAELSRYHWPGNVRELQNVMAALAVAAPARGLVRASLLPAAITGAVSVTSRRLADARMQFDRRCVEVALARAGGSRTRAAAELGLSRQGLLKTMARIGIAAPSCNAPGEQEE